MIEMMGQRRFIIKSPKSITLFFPLSVLTPGLIIIFGAISVLYGIGGGRDRFSNMPFSESPFIIYGWFYVSAAFLFIIIIRTGEKNKKSKYNKKFFHTIDKYCQILLNIKK
jgi:hypothetical protein